ncbi:MAG: phenylalanine--tRNA ligase subunit alpha [Chitinispirillales bacterium]|jgi:phenylalanyl-tRNA synthetase alpha chain|nr:phenylalanine--tRNA ligase subunit alpha [Chitinispirillales bacterium]
MQYNTLESIDALRAAAAAEFQAIVGDADAENFRVKYLGKKGVLREIMKTLGNVSPEERKTLGAAANALREEIESRFNDAREQSKGDGGGDPGFDPALPGFPFPSGSLHPLAQIRNHIVEILASMGFSIAYGPEVESDYNNFEALNMPPLHPARDMQDTFYINEKAVLRTHTSPVQIRVMKEQKPPIRAIMPGRVYRNEEVSARSYCMFYQVEGLFVDKNVSFADLKGTLLAFSRRFFDENTKIKIRPSFFPFTEPSVEVDVECFLCKGKGCGICKHSGWLEILGAGMVHPSVLKSGGIDPEIYSGFAFGMGVERIALLKYGIDDIRLFYENDVRFLKQF